MPANGAVRNMIWALRSENRWQIDVAAVNFRGVPAAIGL